MVGKIDINRSDFYLYKNDDLNERTKNRLIQIAEMGLEEVMVAEFGIPGIMSGLYIEYVWRDSEEDWSEYISWINSLINKTNL